MNWLEYNLNPPLYLIPNSLNEAEDSTTTTTLINIWCNHSWILYHNLSNLIMAHDSTVTKVVFLAKVTVNVFFFWIALIKGKLRV